MPRREMLQNLPRPCPGIARHVLVHVEPQRTNIVFAIAKLRRELANKIDSKVTASRKIVTLVIAIRTKIDTMVR